LGNDGSKKKKAGDSKRERTLRRKTRGGKGRGSKNGTVERRVKDSRQTSQERKGKKKEVEFSEKSPSCSESGLKE